MTAETQEATGDRRSMRAAIAAACIAAFVLAVALLAPGPAASKKKQEEDRPNVVVVMSDDQTADSMRFMRQVDEQLAAEGATFANSFASFPLCCPSRATFLTGQYPHNHGVLSNQPPDGGFQKLDSTNTLAVWLQQAGYHTGHVGKYLNGYEDVVPSVIPPGWSEWYGSTQTYGFYGYQLNENGTIVDYGSTADQYQTDVYTQKAADFIHRRAPESTPFFLSVAYLAPHGGGPNPSPQPPDNCHQTAKPAPRHATAFDSEPLPQPASFNEADVSDKPQAIQQMAPLTAAEIADIQREYRCRIESLLGVDEGVAQIVKALRDEGEFEDTVFVYTSDNGFFHGEHRVPVGKTRVYEPSIRVPLVIHGPGIPDGVESSDLAVNADLAPTILDFADAEASLTTDGASLLPAAASPGAERGRAILLETRSYAAVRTARYVYVEHGTGELELYDLDADPDQVQSLHADAAFDAVEASLAKLLAALRTCSGSGCRMTPALDLKLDFSDGEPGKRECAKGSVKAIVKGADRGALSRADFALGEKQLGSDAKAPFKRRVASGKLRKQGKSTVIVSATLLDGRRVTLDDRVRRCG